MTEATTLEAKIPDFLAAIPDMPEIQSMTVTFLMDSHRVTPRFATPVYPGGSLIS